VQRGNLYEDADDCDAVGFGQGCFGTVVLCVDVNEVNLHNITFKTVKAIVLNSRPTKDCLVQRIRGVYVIEDEDYAQSVY